MEIWNSKPSSSTYVDSEVKSKAFLKINFGQAISFQNSGNQESNASNNVQIEVEMRKLCGFEANWAQKNVEFESDTLNLKQFLKIYNSKECEVTFGKG